METSQTPALKFTRLLTPLLVVVCATPAIAACVDEGPAEPRIESGKATPIQTKDARLQLRAVVRKAIDRSDSYGATKLLAEAAEFDIDEARAGGKPQASLTGTAGAGGRNEAGASDRTGWQTRAVLNMTAPLFDHGRVGYLTGSRTQLAEAARQGQIGSEEQIGLQTVLLMLERGRYNTQAQVAQHYAHRMSCLVGALEQIAKVDKGRTSELVQAVKTQKRAQLSYTQAQAILRQVETRLRRYVGDELPRTEAVSSLLSSLPSVEDALADIERASEIVQLDAQAKALTSYSNAVVAGHKPQLNWVVDGAQNDGPQRSRSWGVGVTLTIPLLNPGAEPAARASVKRAEAARRQFEEALHARRYRVLEVHDQAASAFDRAREVVDVLRDSDRVRGYTMQQWQQLGRRSLFDVMSTESEHYSLRVSHVNALYDAQQSVAVLRSLGRGLTRWLE